MIELGLSRISRLVQQSPLSWKAIHVAGTNGKGSITSYISGLLAAGGVRCGRFTSPHLIDRWDCITINEQVVRESLFRRVEDRVKQRDQQLGLGATEFEILTAIAFEIFSQENVEIGVVEVGIGGRLDATNTLSNVLVSVIAKIGLDHKAFLGNSIQAIAREKAGILKSGVPCVIDGTNTSEVLQVLRNRIRELGIDAVIAHPDTIGQRILSLPRFFDELDLEPHQKANVSCAVVALEKALEQIRPGKKVEDLLPTLADIRWPGRLQQIFLRPLIAREEPILIDGAHNGQSADVLGKYVDRRLRRSGQSVTWIFAASQGKDLSEIFGPLIRSGDNAAAVAFGPVDEMPWIKATNTRLVSEYIRSIPGIGIVTDFDTDILTAMHWASTTAAGSPLVIAGSLYLVSDVFRLLREKQ